MTATVTEEDLEMSDARLLKEDFKEEEDTIVKSADPIPRGFRTRMIDGAYIGLNIASTVTLVFLNKWYDIGISFAR